MMLQYRLRLFPLGACGQQINSDRLKSIPWTSYCLNDENQRDHKWFSQAD
jgi:RNA polymerase-binding transcription factor DksA